MYWCDNRCIDKAIRYWQRASFRVEDDGEAHRINVRQQCYNDRLKKQGLPQLKIVGRRRIVVGFGKLWERIILYEKCGSASLLKEQERKSF